ncbi:alpha/beta hydrolase [Streptomyces sp. NPDC049949]|uniref:alpha/beta fold hydrolase n=1 Tax=Streptomyces sp. NPDC049949 TaxID=3154627 RepID=UPI0034284E75
MARPFEDPVQSKPTAIVRNLRTVGHRISSRGTSRARHHVIAVDLRGMGGMGGSAKPAAGYDKKTPARDVHALLGRLGIGSAHVVGHDIGAMVAYAFAANHPGATRKIALLDVSHPEEGRARQTPLPRQGQRHKWWFACNQVHGLPEQLLAGRFHLLLDWLFENAAADPASVGGSAHCLPEERPEAVVRELTRFPG